MHEYTAAFRVSGEHLAVAGITEAFGLNPTHVVRVGEPQQRGPAKKSVWGFEVFPKGGGEWSSLEDALVALLSVFSCHHAVIRRLQREFEVYLWCGHFSSGLGGGPTLSAKLLKELGEFGVEVHFDNYHSDQNDETSD